MPAEPIRRATRDQFVAAARKSLHDGLSTTPSMVLAKSFVLPEIKQTPEEQEQRILPFTISTADVDRDEDTIAVGGWELDNFRAAGGPVLWAHNSSAPPLGRSITVFPEMDALKSRAQFLPKGLDEFTDLIYELYVRGFMRAVSVGFLPKEFSFSEERNADDLFGWAIDFKVQELLEYSAVPVPANPKALIDAGARGLNLGLLHNWAERFLDGEIVVPHVQSRDVYRMHKTLQGQWGAAKRGASPHETIWRGVPDPEPGSKDALTWDESHPDGTPVERDMDAEWNGPAEVAAADVEDMAIIGTWVADLEEGEDPTKSDYKLPHHRGASPHETIWRGVLAAMGALLGARGGVDIPDDDRRQVYDHLAKHYESFDREPPEFRAYEADELKELFPDKASLTVTLSIDTKMHSVEDCITALTESAILLQATHEAGKEISDDQKVAARAACEMLSKMLGDNEDEPVLELEVDNDFDGLEIDDLDAFTKAIEEAVHETLVLPFTGRLTP